MWDKITLGKFQQLTDIIQGQNFDHEIERSVRLLACLHGKSEEHYNSMRLDKLKAEIATLDFLFTDQLPVTDLPKFIDVNDRRYQPMYVFTKVTAGQFIDCMSAIKDQSQLSYNIHRLLASLCIPRRRNWIGEWVTGKYGDVPYDQVADDMLSVPVITANSIALFFWTAWGNFLEATLGYSARLAEMVTKTAEPSPKDGGGYPARAV